MSCVNWQKILFRNLYLDGLFVLFSPFVVASSCSFLFSSYTCINFTSLTTPF